VRETFTERSPVYPSNLRRGDLEVFAPGALAVTSPHSQRARREDTRGFRPSPSAHGLAERLRMAAAAAFVCGTSVAVGAEHHDGSTPA